MQDPEHNYLLHLLSDPLKGEVGCLALFCGRQRLFEFIGRVFAQRAQSVRIAFELTVELFSLLIERKNIVLVAPAYFKLLFELPVLRF